MFESILTPRLKQWLAGWMNQPEGDCYDWRDGQIVHRRGGETCEAIDPREVDAWWIDREQVVDVVHVRLRDGRVLDWPDARYDLVPLLGRCGLEGARPTEWADPILEVPEVPPRPHLTDVVDS